MHLERTERRLTPGQSECGVGRRRRRPHRCRPGAGCAGWGVARPVLGESDRRTLSGSGAPRPSRPSLRLEMGTDGGKMSRGSSGRRDPRGAPGGAASFPSFSHYFRVKL